MTNEEIQRVMEFIIKQQETFAEGMEQMRGLHAQAETRISKLESAFVSLFHVVTDIGNGVKELTEQQKGLAERIAELTEAQAHTDDRLNVIIDIIQQGRNGASTDNP